MAASYLDPAAFLDLMLSRSESMKAFWAAQKGRHPGCWDLALYLDEVTPGNPLKPLNRRKVWAVYYSYFQLGRAMLQKDFGWFTLLLIKHDEAAALPGGMSQVMVAALKRLVSEEGALANGVFLPSIGKMFQARVKVVLGDEAALKATFQHKGASGIKPCFLCRNVVSVSSELACYDEELVAISSHRKASFQEHTDSSLFQAADYIQSPAYVGAGVGQRKLILKGLGINAVHEAGRDC